MTFANEKAVAEKLNLANDYLSEVSPYADSKEKATMDQQTTEQLMKGQEIKRPASSNSSRSTDNMNVNELKSACVSDDDAKLKALLFSIQPNQKSLLNILSKAVSSRAYKCMLLLLDEIDVLDEPSDLNGRNIIHRQIISLGRQSTGISSSDKDTVGVNRHFIKPAESPQMPINQPGTISGDGTDSTSEVDNLIFLIEHLSVDQRQALIALDDHKRTPLHYAAHYGLKLVTEFVLKFMKEWSLLNDESNLDSESWQDVEGSTPVYLAISGNHPKTCQVLLEHSNTELKNESGYLAIATRKAAGDLINVLLKAGHLDINYKGNESNETALFIAAKLDLVDTLKLLLENGADTEIGESMYGWTPVFVAAVDGYKDITKTLIDAGCNINRCDGSGWTAMEHACLRGHIDLAEMLRPPADLMLEQLHNKTTSVGSTVASLVSPSLPPTSVKTAKDIGGEKISLLDQQPVKTFGHRYLRDLNMIIVTLGSTDQRQNGVPVQLDRVPYSKAHSTQLDTALSLIISVSGSNEEPQIVDLPLSDGQSTEPLTFYVEQVDNVKLYFDLVPTYSGNKKKILGRAVALLPSIHTQVGPFKQSLYQTLTLPIIENDSLEVLGTVKFEFLVVTPFQHPNMGIEKSSTYWKSLSTTRVIGHRGLGMNSLAKKSLQLGENTLESFIQAASLGASYVEFDVQLTKDYVPVIYHDFLVGEYGIDIPMHSLTLEQFLGMSDKYEEEKKNGSSSEVKKKFGNGFSKDDGVVNPRQRSKSMYNVIEQRDDNQDEYDEMYERLKFTRNYKIKKFKGNFRGHSIQAPFATLEKAFKTLPNNVGFNIECKYPMLDESEKQEMEWYAIELNAWVDTVLKCVYDHAGERDIVFSSFHPAVCILLSLKQPSIPVLFLTDSGTDFMADIRASSLQEAIRFAKRWNLLGIVSQCKPLILCPRLVSVVKESGLVCVTYGTENNDPQNARLQMKHGVDAVIVDSVLAIRKGLTSAEDEEKTE